MELNKALIVRPDALGDVILTFPMLVNFKQHYPECKVYYLCSSYTAPLIQSHPLVEGVILDTTNKGKDRQNADGLLKQIIANKFDIVFNCYNELPYPKIMQKAGIPIRVGDAQKFPLSLCHTHKVDLGYRDITNHVLQQNLRLLLPLELPVELTNIDYGLKINNKLSAEVAGLMTKQKDYIVIHPGFGQGNGKALLSEDKFRAVIEHLVSKGENVVITGGPKEVSRNLTICDGFDGVINLTSKTSLLDLVTIIMGAKVMISVDTGPMHLASALKVPIVLLNVTKYIKPSGWGAFGINKIVRPSVKCKHTCFPFTCNYTDCSDGFLSEDIIRAVEEISKIKSMSFQQVKQEMFKASINILNLTNQPLGIEEKYNVYNLNDVDRPFIKFIWNFDINVIVKKKISWFDNLILRNLLAPKLYYPPVFVDRDALGGLLLL